MEIKMKNKYGLVLEGGANRGIFTAGVLDYFMDKGIKFPYVNGVSMGACCAISLISGQQGRTRRTILHEGNDAYYGAEVLLSTGRMINLDMTFDEYPIKQYPFDFDFYFASDIEAEYVVTNMNTGKAEYLTEKSDRKKLMRIVKASSSLPILTKPIEIDGALYMDGGVTDPIPVKRAFLKGCKKCIVVLTKPENYVYTQNSQLSSAASLIYSKNPEFVKAFSDRLRVRQSRLKLLDMLEKAGMVYVIRPTVTAIERFEKDRSKLMNYYMNGYELAERKYEEIIRFLGDETVIFDE